MIITQFLFIVCVNIKNMVASKLHQLISYRQILFTFLSFNFNSNCIKEETPFFTFEMNFFKSAAKPCDLILGIKHFHVYAFANRK